MSNKIQKRKWEASTGTCTYRDIENGKTVTKTTFNARCVTENTKADWLKARIYFCEKPWPFNRGLRLVSLRENIILLKKFRPQI